MQAPVVVRFGNVVVDERRREVSRGGAVVPVQPKVLDVLLYLLRHRDRVVTRDEIFDAVWSDVVVGPASLSRAIREVRKALGDDGRNMVKTVPGHGFRFVAPADDLPVAVSPTAAPAGGRGALYGRARELASLARSLEEATRGRLVARFVCGEPGVGRTHLLEEFGAMATRSGARVLHGRVRHGDAGAPLSAWRDVAEGLGVSLDTDPADGSSGAIRCARARGLVAAVRAASSGGAVAILLDDADRADASSWRVLEDLLDGPPLARVVVVVTLRASARNAPEVLRAAGRALRADPEAVLELSTVDTDALAQIARERLGRPPSVAAVRKLTRLSGGHPLYARHLVAAAIRSGTALESLDVAPAVRTSSLRALVLSHLTEVHPDDRRILDAAGVLGIPFSAHLVAEVASVTPSEAMDSLQASLERGLLESGPGGFFDFVHEIVREVVFDVLTPSVRARLHRRAARALDRPLPDGGAPVDRVVRHYVEGAADGDAERALDVVCGAARSAARAAAFDVASGHLADALRVEALLPPDAARRRALHLELGMSLAKDGRIEEATVSFMKAAPPPTPAAVITGQAAFFSMAPDLPQVVKRFYALLFERHPHVKRLFVRSDPKVQRRMFGETLSALVEHATDDAWLDGHLAGLAGRHREYGVTLEMYDWVRAALLDALDEAAARAGRPSSAHETLGPLYDALARKMRSAEPAPGVSLPRLTPEAPCAHRPASGR
jgi:DNA-binding winged helix-turn-helix (wHTH) protein/hemoglobin-like flavoprotein